MGNSMTMRRYTWSNHQITNLRIDTSLYFDFAKLFMASSKAAGNGMRSLLELSDLLDFHYLKRIMVYSNLRKREN